MYKVSFDLLAVIQGPHPDCNDYSPSELIEAMRKRLDHLEAYPAEAAEAFGTVYSDPA